MWWYAATVLYPGTQANTCLLKTGLAPLMYRVSVPGKNIADGSCGANISFFKGDLAIFPKGFETDIFYYLAGFT